MTTPPEKPCGGVRTEHDAPKSHCLQNSVGPGDSAHFFKLLAGMRRGRRASQSQGFSVAANVNIRDTVYRSFAGISFISANTVLINQQALLSDTVLG